MVFVFLGNLRATLIPIIAVPVALIGTFAVMLALGFSANTISLLALVLAIGIVVDDAIVVVEAVEHILEHEPELTPAEATEKAMSQVTGPIIAITLVLLSVFVPTAFIPGITGQLYKQFAVAVSVSMVISAINALSLSPALCSLLLRHRSKPTRRHGLAAGRHRQDARRLREARDAARPPRLHRADRWSRPSSRGTGGWARWCPRASCPRRTRAPSWPRSSCPMPPRPAARSSR